MRAARYYGKEDVRIENIPEAEVGEGQIKVNPAYVGICGTDLHEFMGGPNFAPTTPHPVTRDKIPITLGHEFSGTVKEVGKGVTGFEPGQKVVVQPTICCGTCGACTNSVENACPKGGFVGLSGGGGGLSDSVVVPASSVLHLPENVHLDIGALVEPLSVAWHAISAAGSAINSNATILVLGGGPIGLAVLQCLQAKKVKQTIVSEVAKMRQDFARDFGADHVLNPAELGDKFVEKIIDLSGGDGVDVAFDCAGVPASIKAACTSVKAQGTVVNVAIWEKDIPFNPNMLVFREANYKAVLGYQRKDFEAVIENLGNGKLQPEQMITSKIQLEDLVEGGIKTLIRDKDKHVKILVEVAATG